MTLAPPSWRLVLSVDPPIVVIFAVGREEEGGEEEKEERRRRRERRKKKREKEEEEREGRREERRKEENVMRAPLLKVAKQQQSHTHQLQWLYLHGVFVFGDSLPFRVVEVTESVTQRPC